MIEGDGPFLYHEFCIPAEGEIMRYVLARTPSKRPTLQHAMDERRSTHTACGLPISTWSRAYQDRPIKVILCKRCAHKVGE